MSATLDPQSLQIGDRFLHDGVVVEVIGDREPTKDRFDRPMIRYMCRRGDTGDSGYMIYGPGALPLKSAGRVPSKVAIHDRNTDAVYIQIRGDNEAPVARTQSVHPSVNLDFDADDNLLGVEVL